MAAFEVRESVAAREQYLYKRGENVVVASGFSCRMPIPLQGSSVEYKDDAIQLGCDVNTRFDDTTHLQHFLPRPLQVASVAVRTCQPWFTFCCPQDIHASAHVASIYIWT